MTLTSITNTNDSRSTSSSVQTSGNGALPKDASQLFYAAATGSTLSQLVQDEAKWHQVMGETYGYDPDAEADSDAELNSEALRMKVQKALAAGNETGLADLGINIEYTDTDTLKGETAAFVGGDTATLDDDKILVNEEAVANSATSDAVAEEIFHAFERQIHMDADTGESLEGDMQLIDGEAAFAEEGTGEALDEGRLGRTLSQGLADNAATAIENDEFITVEDKADITLHNEETGDDDTVSAEFNDIIDYLESLGMNVNDTGVANEYINAAKSGKFTNDQINSTFTQGGVENSVEMMDIINEDTGNNMLWLTDLGAQSGTQGVQDYLAYLLEDGQPSADSLATLINVQMDEEVTVVSLDPVVVEVSTVGQQFLNSFSLDELNGLSDNGIRLNAEVLQHFSTDILENLDDGRSDTAVVQEALALQGS